MREQPPKLITVGVIAQACKVPIHRVTQILKTRPHIAPAAFAGNVRLFNREAMAMVRHEINTIDAKRSSRGEAVAHAG